MIHVAINGFGRIGRNLFKAGLEMEDLNFVAINDLTDTKTLAYLLEHDTAYGQYTKYQIDYDEQHLIVGDRKIPVFSKKDPAGLPWKEYKVDIVAECTGVFLTEESASAHLEAGAKGVVLSAPAKTESIPTYLLGVNEDEITGKETIISNASCTTNCISPVMNIIHRELKVKRTFMTTIHAYTAKQALQDMPNKDPRRGRAACVNMIPTTTGAAKATCRVIPELKGFFDGIAIRVPVLVGSLADFTLLTDRKTSVEEVNALFIKMAEQEPYKGIVGVTDKPLVSSDFVGSSFSAIVDLSFTRVIEGDFIKLLAWYDNEWAYSMRLAKMIHVYANKIIK